MNRATTRLAERTSSLLASARTKGPSDYSSSGLTVATCDGLLPRRHSSRQATGHHPGTGSFLLDVSAPKCTTRSGSYTPTGADSARSVSKGFPPCGGQLSTPGTRGCIHPRWSPDGTKIIFDIATPRGAGEVENVYIANANGSGVTQVTRGGWEDDAPD